MIHAEKFHKWLAQPDLITEADYAAASEVLSKYPYFIPGRYIESIAQGRKEGITPELLSRLYMYRGNWLMLYKMMGQQPEEQPAVIAPETEFFEKKVLQELKVEDVVVPQLEVPEEDPLVVPVFTEDYFLHQGIRVSETIVEAEEFVEENNAGDEHEKSLMVVRSFAEWLAFFKRKSEKEREEEDGKRALKSMWQKEKLAAAIEEESDEIPDDVFNMAVSSISREEGLISESLAEILVRQGKHEKAIEMYRKLSLRNPQKNAYFVGRIEQIQKNMKS